MTLAGHSIVVCRASHQATPLLDRLERLGAQPVHIPLIEVVPPLDNDVALRLALQSAGSDSWLALTSANGVDAVDRALGGERPTSRVAVVGGATADRARLLGWSIDHVASAPSAAGLAASLPPGDPVIAPLAELASDDLVDGLELRGFDVVSITAYRTVTPAVSPADLERLVESAAVLVTAPSVIQRLVHLVDPDRLPPLIAIGPTSAAAITDLGLDVADQASEPGVDGLIDAVVRTLVS